MKRAAAILGILWLTALAPAIAEGPTAPGVGEGTAAASPMEGSPATSEPRPGFSPPGTLYVVATSHLDTQWRWTVKETIEQFLPATLRDNFAHFDTHPDYVFSFEGAFRYLLMREYYPEEYERMKREIAAGRWRVAGSWVDAVDTNMPSPESLIRHVLYGNGYFRREFGKTSADVFLPDCFGFGYALPSIAAHCGLTGFSTQKLTWGSAVGVPFDVGLWEGVDGSRLFAALNPGEYVGKLDADLSADSSVAATIAGQAERSGLHVAYRYFGTGDQGGAPTAESVEWLEKSLHGAGPVRVRSVASDQLARDLSAALRPEQRDELPLYKGELLMTDHGAGCYTSQAEMKRWNRRNERTADAAERAAVLADWLGGAAYPRETLREAWVRFLWHQFHDDLTGTSIPEAYAYSWNDEAISCNQFEAVLDGAAGAVCRALDRQVKGVPLVVYNPLSSEREDIVEATVVFPERGGKRQTPDAGAPRLRGFSWGRAKTPGDGPGRDAGADTVVKAVRVFGPNGREVPSQTLQAEGRQARVAFLARVPSVGLAVYDVRAAESRCELPTGLTVGSNLLENERYMVGLDGSGDVCSIIDKRAGRELLASPLQLQMIADRPWDWPAWEVDYDDLMAPAEVVAGPVQVRLRESGPARVALEVTREAHGSRITQVLSLGAGGAGDRLEIRTDVDWRSPGRLLKAAFPFSFSNEVATYDLGLGTIERGVNRPQLYEVPAQQWADLTDAGGGYGAAVLNDCKYGWDRPDAHTLRLSLVRTPEVNERWQWVKDQGSQDLGRHRMAYAIAGHIGDWRAGGVPWQADRLNQPLRAWQAAPGKGPLGRSFSLFSVDSSSVAVQAVKLAEESDECIVRLQERSGRPVSGVHLRFARPIASARELNGAEEPLGDLAVDDGRLGLDFHPYQPRTVAVRLGKAPARLDRPRSQPLALPFNLRAATPCRTPSGVDFDGEGRALPLELMPAELACGDIGFSLGPTTGEPNAVACMGQEIALPRGQFNRLYLLAAAVGGDRDATCHLDGRPLTLRIQDWAEPVCSWDSRLVGGRVVERAEEVAPGFLKRGRVGWIGTHRHTREGEREAYAFAQLFRYRLDLPVNARTLRLPDDTRIRIFAATAAQNPNDDVAPADDRFDPEERTMVRIDASRMEFLDSTEVRVSTPTAGAILRYTLDGSMPDERSASYEGPITLTGSAVIRARAMRPEMDDRFTATLEVRRMPWHEAVTSGNPKLGLAGEYFSGRWSKLPDFSALRPERAWIAEEVAIPSFAPPEHFGLRFRGYLHVPEDGLYTLHLWSDDGSALWLGEEMVIDHDGLHGSGEMVRQLALRAGYHALRVEYFQAPGDRALALEIEGPGLPRQPVPAAMLGR